ncbi:Ecp36-1 [Fulvia fulva]|uniref:Ecp36-1 n=1 Tax=Passalora fulva TaxID=5499 RepID=A0A1P8YXK5_PASFU|nr:Ecp36-1 [Fulvia fulva]AQA29240.1 extracellular protein 36-1 [Fulvia fulva]KAK4618954.1 Ecp36-1 [Fulvia fulva]UJO21191.1 Ecp36-1 [Fulvia fulva]
MYFLRLLSVILLAASPTLAKRGSGGECRTQSDCCYCDPGSGCILSCQADRSSTTGYRCITSRQSACNVAGCSC